MQFKDARARFDVSDDTEASGTFEAIVSVFGNVDAAGERVLPGAFTKSIERWRASGDPVPIVYSHAHRDPQALLGGVLDMRETNEGLWVKGQLELESPTAALVHRHMRNRTIRKFSFAYDVLGSHPSKSDRGVLDLTELDIIEVGPTLIPANSATELLAVKHAADALLLDPEASDRSLANAAKDAGARLQDALDAVNEVLAQLDPPDDEKGAIASHSTSTIDQPWDASPNVSRASTEEVLRTIHAWVDEDGNPEARSSYRFPHHAVDARARAGAANVRACIAGIAILNGARGGTNVPDSDRRGVYAHLARHLRDAGMDPPPLAGSSDSAAPSKDWMRARIAALAAQNP